MIIYIHFIPNVSSTFNEALNKSPLICQRSQNTTMISTLPLESLICSASPLLLNHDIIKDFIIDSSNQ